MGDEAAHSRRERPPQVSGPPETGQHHHRAARQRLGDAQPVHSRHLDVQHDHVGTTILHGLRHQVSPGHLGHHLDVRLQAQQGGDRPPDQMLVVGQQYPDHRIPSSGIVARSLNSPPLLPSPPTVTDPPTVASRSDSPASPVPPRRPSPPPRRWSSPAWPHRREARPRSGSGSPSCAAARWWCPRGPPRPAAWQARRAPAPGASPACSGCRPPPAPRSCCATRRRDRRSGSRAPPCGSPSAPAAPVLVPRPSR